VKNDLAGRQERLRDVLGVIWGISGVACPEMTSPENIFNLWTGRKHIIGSDISWNEESFLQESGAVVVESSERASVERRAAISQILLQRGEFWQNSELAVMLSEDEA